MTQSTIEEIRDSLQRLREALGQDIVGQSELLHGLLLGLLANGHVLVEGVPGLGKTRAVHRLARLGQLDFQRLQFTPDLLPADILGTRIYNQHVAEFETVRGPIFAHFVLADEINRAPPKVQSALLETMQERQVTIARESHPLPSPFLVFATQNPIEQEGTYPLPEAQLDRFMLKLVVSYPSRRQEAKIVRLVLDEEQVSSHAFEPLSREEILAFQNATRSVFVEERVIDYATRLVQATRQPDEIGLELGRYIDFGASPRGSIALIQAARANAVLDGRAAARPDDVKAVAMPALRHRILTTYFAEAERISSDQIVDEILATVPVP